MRYFFDTEFIENGPMEPIYLLSIGIVAEDGREFYGVNNHCPLRLANDFVKEHVIPNLGAVETGPGYNTYSPPFLKRAVLDFIGNDSSPEFWAYYADYDWVVLCQLFGTMVDLPKGWPMYCRDIKQWCDALGNPRLPEQGKGEHNALADARWNRVAWEFLERLKENANV